MSDTKIITVSGTIGDVFAHRFTIVSDDGKTLLADLGPKGVEAFALHAGLQVTAEGEMKPSELKVTRIATASRPAVAIDHKGKHGDDPEAVKIVTAAAVEAGYVLAGQPHRKPKHFDVPVTKDGVAFDLHVELDGQIRKAKLAARPAAAA